MKTQSLIAALLMMSTGLVLAENSQEAAVRKLLEPKLGKNTKINSITKTPYSGLFEVQVGAEIIYTDKDTKYFIVGNVIDAKSSANYTKQRIDEFNKINFADLPLESALKMVKGNGKRIIATFEDPNCGPCKQIRRNIQAMDNITVYTFMYNILAEDSASKAKNIWCSVDKNKAWDEWMLSGKPAPAAEENCVAPNDKILALGKKLRINATPTTLFTDGSRLAGAVDVKTLESKFAAIR